MELGVYLCNCGSSVSDKVDYEKVIAATKGSHEDIHFSIIDFMCSEEGEELFEKDLRDNGIERTVIAACSPRDHESTFMHCMERCGLNPYLMHMANVREQIAWVTEDREAATAKAVRYVNAGIARVSLQEPLTTKQIEVSPDVCVIGAGPAGLKAALSLAESDRKVVVVHCVGSLDERHMSYCSGVCCQYAFKFNHIIRDKIPEAKIVHFYKELAISGKEESALYFHVKEDLATTFIRYDDIDDLKLTQNGARKTLSYVDSVGKKGKVNPDMVILCPAVVPTQASGKLGAILDIAHDRFGFYEELHGRMDFAKSKIKGVYLAGTCQSPMDISKAINQGMAASGYILSGLVSGRKLTIEPIVAVVDEDRCSGCRVCVSVCPYKAVDFNDEKEVSRVNELLCQGCGTCVSACPAGAMKGNHFTNDEIFADIEGVLA